MKTSIHFQPLLVLTIAALILSTSGVEARRAYGVSGDRGSAVAGPRGAAWSGQNSSGAVTRHGGAIATDNGVAVAGRRGVAVAGDNNVAVARRSYPTTLPAYRAPAVVAPVSKGYVRVLPSGSRTVVYGGYTCFFVGGVYYRPVFYGGETVYIVVP